MNLYRFINSKDIRNHLKEIGYEFNSLEAAWLIYQCHDASLEEKHNAWNELKDTMPDCRIEERFNTVGQNSLHDFLFEYTCYQNSKIKELQEGAGNSVYKLREYCGEENCWYEENRLFSDYENCIAYAENEYSNADKIAVRKQTLNTDAYSEIILLPDKTVLDLSVEDLDCEKEAEKYDLYHCSFAGMCFFFPTPFKKGDILWIPYERYTPFVLDAVAPDMYTEVGRTKCLRNGDETDMRADGYFIECGSDSKKALVGVFYDSIWNYMDLEYYPGELQDENRVLSAFSSYVKGEINEIVLVRTYHQILTEESFKQII